MAMPILPWPGDTFRSTLIDVETVQPGRHRQCQAVVQRSGCRCVLILHKPGNARRLMAGMNPMAIDPIA